ncbi:hypothetical protein JVX91_17270 [Pseudomonas sp. PDNC002]|uniref:hypothetical protein n=1 Tax=Pseudomonas sp. PDNC002 TaxID=2811422 RepID=UPI001965231F|nr:hypothetical protein [Pseudomonas sp. PDNC002]QRY77358.1 hypothetical protein JVX91_17270 [Pseudomonas sp. PDNC002]
MPLGKWGKTLKSKGFDEPFYLGDEPIYIDWCMNKPTFDFDAPANRLEFAKLPDSTKQKLRDVFSAKDLGNCGELANYFLRYATQLSTSTEAIAFIQETLDKNPNGLFRITVGNTHTFIGIRSTTSGEEVEIIQAWQEKYSVKSWLSTDQNIYTIPTFIEKLKDLSDISKRQAAGDFLFSTSSKKISLPNPMKVTKFAFKPQSPSEMDSILNNLSRVVDPNLDHGRKADFYLWLP